MYFMQLMCLFSLSISLFLNNEGRDIVGNETFGINSSSWVSIPELPKSCNSIYPTAFNAEESSRTGMRKESC
jgi:hypothetical protein